jgi:hypothetical protein
LSEQCRTPTPWVIFDVMGRLNHFRLAGFLLLSCAAIALVNAEDDPAPPAWLKPYVVDGALSYSDLEWARPRWATDEKGKSEWRSALDWVAVVKKARTAAVADGLRRAGVAAVALGAGCYGNDTCQQIDVLENGLAVDPPEFSSWDVLNAAAKEASHYVEGFRYALETTAHVEGVDEKRTLRDKLLEASVLDQTYMIGLTGFRYPERHLPALSPSALVVFDLALEQRMRTQFKTNAEMLKTAIAEHGWPKRSEIGESAEDAAWLIVQHADHDPVFQYEALGLISGRVKEGEADPKNAAYLYDRIMLKIAGKQRYGTQLECKGGRLEAQPLEDAERVDEIRGAVKLPSLTAYISGFSSTTCQRAESAPRP